MKHASTEPLCRLYWVSIAALLWRPRPLVVSALWALGTLGLGAKGYKIPENGHPEFFAECLIKPRDGCLFHCQTGVRINGTRTVLKFTTT